MKNISETEAGSIYFISHYFHIRQNAPEKLNVRAPPHRENKTCGKHNGNMVGAPIHESHSLHVDLLLIHSKRPLHHGDVRDFPTRKFRTTKHNFETERLRTMG
jgi:hypothetical protein